MSAWLAWESGVRIEADEATYRRFLRLPHRRELDGPLAENARRARVWFNDHARPWWCAVETEPGRWPHAIAAVRAAPRAAIVAVSAGPEASAESALRWADGEPDRHYFLECYAFAVCDSLLRLAKRRLGTRVHDGPGYRSWPLENSGAVLAAILETAYPPGPLEALPSGMLRPKASQLALIPLPPA
jgi:hypothetical protein